MKVNIAIFLAVLAFNLTACGSSSDAISQQPVSEKKVESKIEVAEEENTTRSYKNVEQKMNKASELKFVNQSEVPGQ